MKAVNDAFKCAQNQNTLIEEVVAEMTDKDLTIAASTCEARNVADDMKSWTLQDVQAEQKKRSLPFAVACMNIAGDLNLGVILRTATMFCAEKFFVLGKRHWDRRSAVGAHNYIETVVCPSEAQDGVIPRDTLDELMTAYGYYPVFVELGGVALDKIGLCEGTHGRFICYNGSYRHLSSPKPCLIFGNEHYGISKEYIKDSLVISVDQGGVMRSLNVSAAASITIHHFYRILKND